MQTSTPSRTALSTALQRARHVRLDPLRIIDDPWGDRLVPDAVREFIAQFARAEMTPQERAAAGDTHTVVDAWLRANAAYANVLTRSRFTEDALHEAVACGVRQYVLLGAGLDSYALRRPAAGAALTRVIEIDHPATQAFKLQRIAACGVDAAAAARFVAADLAQERLDDVLARAGFERDVPAFFSWLGVTMYLTLAANEATLLAIARCAAPGSEVVFTYIDQAAFDADPAAPGNRFAQMQRKVTAIGEPFLSGFHPARLGTELRTLGYELLEDLTDAQQVARYDPQGANGLASGGYSRIARARLVQRQKEKPP